MSFAKDPEQGQIEMRRILAASVLLLMCGGAVSTPNISSPKNMVDAKGKRSQ